MTAAWLALSLLSALGFYLASTHQRLWPRAHGHAGALRIVAALCAAAASVAATAAMGATAGVFSVSTAFMLAAVLLPCLDAWRQLRATRNGDGHVG